jgi:hypothetical protein
VDIKKKSTGQTLIKLWISPSFLWIIEECPRYPVLNAANTYAKPPALRGHGFALTMPQRKQSRKGYGGRWMMNIEPPHGEPLERRN